jgi:hypothetical protein
MWRVCCSQECHKPIIFLTRADIASTVAKPSGNVLDSREKNALYAQVKFSELAAWLAWTAGFRGIAPPVAILAPPLEPEAGEPEGAGPPEGNAVAPVHPAAPVPAAAAAGFVPVAAAGAPIMLSSNPVAKSLEGALEAVTL